MTNYVMVSEALIRPLFLFELLDDTLVGFTLYLCDLVLC